MCCFFNKAYLRVPFDIIKQYKVILLYHCWNHVVFSFIVVKDAASHSTNYSLPPGGGPPDETPPLVNFDQFLIDKRLKSLKMNPPQSIEILINENFS